MKKSPYPAWLAERIGQRTLSAKYAHIVRELTESPETYLLVSVNEFAAHANVSPATVCRCIQFLGYDGYDDFQSDMKERLLQPHKLTSVYNYLEADANGGESTVRQLLDAEAATLSGLFADMDSARLQEAAAEVAGAQRVHLMGYGSSTALVQFLQYRLMRIGLDVTDMSAVSHLNMLAEHGVHMQASRDVIITVSFRGVYENLVHLLEFANAFHIRSVAFSENPDSAVSKLSTYRIPIRRAVIHEFKSLAAPMSVMNFFAMQTSAYIDANKASIARRLAWFRKYQDKHKIG